MERFETADTGVFWDVEDCEIQDGLNALMVSQNMRSALERLNYRGKVFIYAYGDSNQISDDINAHGDRNVVVKQTPNKFDYRALDNPAPTNIILVLGDNMSRRQEEFKNALGQVNMLSYNIHFAYPQKSICPSLPAVRVNWLWESLSLGGNPLSSVWEKEKEKFI
ncbi:hypothetical protein Bca4012_068352 [Brassica carinata]